MPVFVRRKTSYVTAFRIGVDEKPEWFTKLNPVVGFFNNSDVISLDSSSFSILCHHGDYIYYNEEDELVSLSKEAFEDIYRPVFPE